MRQIFRLTSKLGSRKKKAVPPVMEVEEVGVIRDGVATLEAADLEKQIPDAAEALTEDHDTKWRFNAQYFFLIGLLLSYFIANYQFKALVTVLTDVWNLNLAFAVMVINVHEGSRAVLVIFTAWLADTYAGDSLTLAISAVLYAAGLLVWYFMYPGYAATYFFAGLILITIGQCGYEYHCSKCEYKAEEKNEVEQKRDAEQLESKVLNKGLVMKMLNQLKLILKTYWIQIVGLSIVLFLTPKQEYKNFLIAALLLLATSFIFLLGNLLFFPLERPDGRSPLTIISNVYLAAVKKQHNDVHQTRKYFGDQQGSDMQNQNSEQHLIEFSNQLWCLNRAALYNPEKEDPKLELQRKRLCTVKQVEDTKQFTKSILFSSVFLMYGIMTCVGGNFFVEQASRMDAHIGVVTVPVELFVLGSEAVSKLVSYICQCISIKFTESGPIRFNGALRMGLGMLLSTPCFAIAYAVESKRLRAINGDFSSYISAFWLTPQFVLLGTMDGLAVDGIADFFEQEMPTYIAKPYGRILSEGALGIGKLLTALGLIMWYYGTKIIGKYSFGWDINESHLDYYYVAMAIFGCVSFIIYVCVAIIHSRRQSHRDAGLCNKASQNGDGDIADTTEGHALISSRTEWGKSVRLRASMRRHVHPLNTE